MQLDNNKEHKAVRVSERTAGVKRPLVGVSLGYPLYDEMLRAAETEPVRGIGAFALELVRYGWRVYRTMGSLKALKGAEPESAEEESAPKRVSQELYEELKTAMRIILEHAPSTVIEEMTSYLTSRAGKFAGPKKEKLPK